MTVFNRYVIYLVHHQILYPFHWQDWSRYLFKVFLICRIYKNQIGHDKFWHRGRNCWNCFRLKILWSIFNNYTFYVCHIFRNLKWHKSNFKKYLNCIHLLAGDESRHQNEGDGSSPDWREQRRRLHRNADHRQQVVQLPPDLAREWNVVLKYQG